MFVLFVQVFVFYYGMFCDCLTIRQIILSLKTKKLLYVIQTFEDTIYQSVACKNRVLSAFTSDNQRNDRPSCFYLYLGLLCNILIAEGSWQ